MVKHSDKAELVAGLLIMAMELYAMIGRRHREVDDKCRAVGLDLCGPRGSDADQMKIGAIASNVDQRILAEYRKAKVSEAQWLITEMGRYGVVDSDLNDCLGIRAMKLVDIEEVAVLLIEAAKSLVDT